MTELPPSMVAKFVMYMSVLPVLTDVLQWTFLAGGAALVLVSLVAAFCNPCTRPDPETRRGSRAWLQQDADVNNKAVRKQLPELLIVEAERQAANALKHGMAREREMQVYRSLLAPDDATEMSSSNASSRRTSFEQAYC